MSVQELFPFTRVLDTNGDGTGSVDAAQDFSITQGVFYIQPPWGSIYQITELIVLIADDRVDREDRYGDIAGGVTNGVGVFALGDSGSVLLNQQLQPKTNLDWLDYGTPIWNPFTPPPGYGRVLQVRSSLDSRGGDVRLEGVANERIEVRLDDDFSTLNEHRFSVKGLADVPL